MRQSPTLSAALGCRSRLGRVAGGCRPRFGGSWVPPGRRSRREGRRHTDVASGTGAPAARHPPKGMTAWCPAQSTMPEIAARSRSGPHRQAPDSARSACARPAPPAGHRSAGRAPGPCGGRGPRPHPAAPAADHGGRGLDLELPLITHDLRGEDFKAVQAKQHRPGPTTVLTHLGPPLAGRHTSASYARSQVLFWRLLRHLSSTPHAS